MLKGYATAAGTRAYADRFPGLPGNYRPMLGLAVGSIGIGTYLGKNDDTTDRAYETALQAALLGGINLVDTAINYRFQRSERVIGKVVAELVAAGQLRREEVVIATKGGYITFDGEIPPDPRAWFEEHFVRTGIVGPGDMVEGVHCMTPRYLEKMIELSRANLDLETIDIYYLHNPESQLSAIDRVGFQARIKSAFEFLERKVGDGAIRFYGTATWNGYRVPPDDQGYIALTEIVKVATEVGGAGHHFRVIQLPYNLAMPEAFTRQEQPLPDGTKGSALAAADAAGLAVCASASLLQGRLVRGLPELLGQAFGGMDFDSQRALQFVRSTPGVNVALVGMSSAGHVPDNLATATHPLAPFESLMKLFKSPD
ncbi:MAG: aldo/keto reductase [Candidatus Binataceae bacterium]